MGLKVVKSRVNANILQCIEACVFKPQVRHGWAKPLTFSSRVQYPDWFWDLSVLMPRCPPTVQKHTRFVDWWLWIGHNSWHVWCFPMFWCFSVVAMATRQTSWMSNLHFLVKLKLGFLSSLILYSRSTFVGYYIIIIDVLMYLCLSQTLFILWMSE